MKLAWLLLLPWAIDCSSVPICAITYKSDRMEIMTCHQGLSEDDCQWQKDFVDAMNEAHMKRASVDGFPALSIDPNKK